MPFTHLQLTTHVKAAYFVSIVQNNPKKHAAAAHEKSLKLVDQIRFAAIAMVVWVHCTLGMEFKHYTSVSGVAVQALVMQAGKAGTILFFLISGILLQLKLPGLSCANFIKRRSKTLIVPWLAAIAAFCMLMVVNMPGLYTFWQGRLGVQRPSINMLTILNSTLFDTTYWFVLVYFLTAMVLIALKKYIYHRAAGVVFGLLTLFYCANLYRGWVSVNHTKAFLGYVFIMWLGVIIGRHFTAFRKFLAGVPWALLLAPLAVSIVAACAESYWLRQHNCAEPYSTLRFSNVVYSLLLFTILLKRGDVAFVGRLNPRKYTYSIYLVHFMVIYEITVLLGAFIKAPQTASSGGLLLRELVFFTVVFASTYLLVMLYKKTKAALFGQPANSVQPGA